VQQAIQVKAGNRVAVPINAYRHVAQTADPL
jgi:hypothetical protein